MKVSHGKVMEAVNEARVGRLISLKWDVFECGCRANISLFKNQAYQSFLNLLNSYLIDCLIDYIVSVLSVWLHGGMSRCLPGTYQLTKMALKTCLRVQREARPCA